MTVRKEFSKDLEKLTLDTSTLKDGSYLFHGEMAPSWWHSICKNDFSLPEKGYCKVNLTISVRAPLIEVRGDIEVMYEREDVRSLEKFDQVRVVEVDEQLVMPGHEIEGALPLDDQMLDMAELVREHVILNFDPHPLKNPNSRGGFIVSDGLDEELKEEKNPFSALKHLKS